MQDAWAAARGLAESLGAPTLALALALAIALALVALGLAWRRPGGDRGAAARHRALEERLEALAQDRLAADGRIDARLKAQELAIERRLERSSDRLGETLDRSRAATHATLTGLAERLGRIDSAQARLTALTDQISGLERALGDKQARGAFGEARLSDLLRDALPPDAFAEQATLSNGRRVDALLLLPAPPGPIAIDSKFPLESFLAIRQSADRQAETQARRAFARDVARHVGDIAGRYLIPGETADCALMFVPSEAVYGEIHEQCRDVVEKAFSQRVYIVSPTTLWATLNTARAILRDARAHEHAAVLQAEAVGLADEAAKLADRAEAARRKLDQAVGDLDALASAARAAERRGRRIAELDLAAFGSNTDASA